VSARGPRGVATAALTAALTAGCAAIRAPRAGATPPAPTAPTDDTTSPTRAAPPRAPLIAAEANGLWQGDWGPLLLELDRAGGARGVYAYQDGVILGHLAGHTLRGVWCEPATSRAGEFLFEFLPGDQDLRIDGAWRTDPDQPWSEDWDLIHVDDPPPATLRARLDDPATTCPETPPP
jgi:hypothetical protein